uniref:Protein N-terminal glutamine amidohydrolase n=1 Tax=Anthurium amnicola TaxID=1678845 RepID=A0A1D1ZH05_9ARAE
MVSDGVASPTSGDGGCGDAHLGAPPPLPARGVDAPALQLVTASSFTYTPYYCEENAYFLCKHLSLFGVADREGLDLFVVFISNEKKQKASKRVDGLVIWDYHVICIQSRRNGKGDVHHLVWDLDSSLPFPLALNEYAIETFQPLHHPMPNRLFRLVHAPIFLRCFASDRAHMKDPSGSWISPPPTYNPIVAEGAHPLYQYSMLLTFCKD